jgi:hypothetical protein
MNDANACRDSLGMKDLYVSHDEPDLCAGRYGSFRWTRGEQSNVEIGTLPPGDLRMVTTHPRISYRLVLTGLQWDFEDVAVDLQRSVEVRGM